MPSHAPMLTRDGCPSGRSFAILTLWPSMTDICSTRSAERRSSIRRSWRSFSVSRTPRSTEPLTGLLAERIVGKVSHGTAHLPSSQRYHLTSNGIGEAAETLVCDTPSDFVRAYPVSREWLILLIRRMDAVAAVYRLAANSR